MTALLEVRDVVKHYGGVVAVDGASLDVEERSITGLIGPNGAGKTTLFNIISGFRRPERGTVRFAGERIERRSPDRVARSGLVRTFQQTKALTRMTVLDNMMLAAPAQPGEHLWRLALSPRAVRGREREVEERARELLAVVRLERHVSEYAGTLSGGQRKLLEFARALMVEPRMVMLDEPMAGVNPTLGLQLLERVAGAARLAGDDLPADRARPRGRDGGERHRPRDEQRRRDRLRARPPRCERNPDVIDAYLGKHGDPPARGAPEAARVSDAAAHRARAPRRLRRAGHPPRRLDRRRARARSSRSSARTAQASRRS